MTTPTVARVKKLINRVDDVVPESLSGLGAAHPDLVQIDALNRVVLRAGGPKQGKVGLVSGGGSGHEPLHGGFVGLGMLDAACAGNERDPLSTATMEPFPRGMHLRPIHADAPRATKGAAPSAALVRSSARIPTR